MKNTTLIIEPRGGLGNRFLAISSAFNLAKDCNIGRVILLWDNINECGCDYRDVFESIPDNCKVYNLKFINESYKLMLRRFKLGLVVVKAFQRGLYKLYKLLTRKMHLDANSVKTKEDQEQFRNKVQTFKGKNVFIESYNQFYGEVDLSMLEFNKEIVDKVTKFKKNVGAYDAMHIRRTDNDVAIKNSPTELFYEKMKKLVEADPEAQVYLATDDQGILEDMRNKYPANVLSEASSAVSRRTKEGIQFALYEMLILAGARNLYASYFSTFSSVASYIGGNNIIVLKTNNVD